MDELSALRQPKPRGDRSEEPRADVSRRQTTPRLLARAALVLLAAWALLVAGWALARLWEFRPPPPRGVLPGEFEPYEALLLAWPDLEREFHDGQGVVGVLIDVIAQVRAHAQICLLVSSQRDQVLASDALRRVGVPPESIRFIPSPYEVIWSRDYGPLVIRSYHGGYDFLNARYASVDRPDVDHVPQAVAKALGARTIPIPLTLDGGNLLSNGAGLCIATESLLDENRNRGQRHVRETLREFFGAEQVVFLEPLVGELTKHVDMFCTFTSVDTVVVGAYDTAVDPVNAAVLDRNAQRLSRVRTPCGPLKVVRIPMPPRWNDHWMTYTNVVFANGLLLVPTFAESPPEIEAAALNTYRRLLPGWKVVGVDVAPLLMEDGGLHCATMNLHRLPESAP